MTSPVVQCATCIHYMTRMQCKAFDSIPLEVWFSKVSHADPLPGDRGYQYRLMGVATKALKTSMLPSTDYVSTHRVNASKRL